MLKVSFFKAVREVKNGVAYRQTSTAKEELAAGVLAVGRDIAIPNVLV